MQWTVHLFPVTIKIWCWSQLILEFCCVCAEPSPEQTQGFSLEEKSKTSKKRVHYMKFTKGNTESVLHKRTLMICSAQNDLTESPACVIIQMKLYKFDSVYDETEAFLRILFLLYRWCSGSFELRVTKVKYLVKMTDITVLLLFKGNKNHFSCDHVF